MNEAVADSSPKKFGAINKLLNIFTVIFVVFCAGLLLDAYLSKGGNSILGYRSYIVLTGSMNPTFDAGSYIIVKETKPEDIYVGDILTYKVESNAVLTHRVMEIEGEGDDKKFLTKGDANNAFDKKLVARDQVIGVAVFWVNGLGAALVGLRKPQCMVLVLAGLFVIYMTPWLYRRIKISGGGKTP